MEDLHTVLEVPSKCNLTEQRLDLKEIFVRHRQTNMTKENKQHKGTKTLITDPLIVPYGGQCMHVWTKKTQTQNKLIYQNFSQT